MFDVLPYRGCLGPGAKATTPYRDLTARGRLPAPKGDAMNQPQTDAFVFPWETKAFFIAPKETP